MNMIFYSSVDDSNQLIHNGLEKLSDYDDELYKFYHHEESQVTSNSCYNLDSETRKKVIDWLIKIHYEQKLMPETIYLCVNIFDRFLSKSNSEVTTIEKLKLLGLASMLLASKYEQRSAVGVYDIEYLAEYSYFPKEICEMEKHILQQLHWNLTIPTPYVFLVRNIRASLVSDEDKIMENMACFFSELSLTQYSIMCDYKPSTIAASAVYCARIIVGRYPFWSNELKMCTGYSQEKLLCCVKVMMELCYQTCREGNMEVFKKFSSLRQFRVSCVVQEVLEQAFLF
ncbi:G2/mitotic-specific cyclin S13-7 [Trifolium repens]|nr:G2/mitotic-specific cyclin S13-7 [Trifolium repens]